LPLGEVNLVNQVAVAPDTKIDRHHNIYEASIRWEDITNCLIVMSHIISIKQ